MKKILIFNDCLKFGGTEALLVDILNHLASKHCDVTLLLPAKTSNDVLLESVSSKILVKYLHSKPLSGIRKIVFYNFIAFFPALYSKLFLNLKKYDLIISFKDSPYSSIFSRNKCSKILWVHNIAVVNKYETRTFKERISVALQKFKMRRYIKSYSYYENVICVSKACRDKFIEIYNKNKSIKGQNIRVLYNAIDLGKIDNLSDEIVDTAPFDSPHFIMVTRYSTEKRVDRVIEAAKKLKDEGYKFIVDVWGDGPFYQSMTKYIASYSLENIIRQKGYTQNPYPHIKQADWLICSSERESFGLVLLESVYLKTPFITTDCGGPSEISDNGKYGILTANSTEGVYEGMKKALDTPSLSDTYISKANECLSRFDHEKWLLEIDKILGVL